MTEFEYKTIAIDTSQHALIGIAQKSTLIFKRPLHSKKQAAE